jgi:hypothetical protein
MPIQRQKSNRLYFKKWAYRIECSIYGGWNIRPFIKKNVPFQRSTTEVFYYGWGAVSDREEAILKKFFNIVSPKLQDKSATQYRIEGNTFNIFCNDPKKFNDVAINVLKDRSLINDIRKNCLNLWETKLSRKNVGTWYYNKIMEAYNEN